jgi:hypothetical protein
VVIVWPGDHHQTTAIGFQFPNRTNSIIAKPESITHEFQQIRSPRIFPNPRGSPVPEGVPVVSRPNPMPSDLRGWDAGGVHPSPVTRASTTRPGVRGTISGDGSWRPLGAPRSHAHGAHGHQDHQARRHAHSGAQPTDPPRRQRHAANATRYPAPIRELRQKNYFAKIVTMFFLTNGGGY